VPKITAFETYYQEYDDWFLENQYAYQSELDALQSLLPAGLSGVEIGIGTGRFAMPLGIRVGIDPSPKMAAVARSLGLEVHEAVAENLPFPDAAFDFALMVTTICFVDDVDRSLSEAYRILKPGGCLLIGFVDRESELGRAYLKKKETSRFYREATFYSTKEVVLHLEKTGFHAFQFRQTLFHLALEEIEEVKEGFGEGGFVVVKSVKSGARTE
jgi:SAM-dependent methyltransferase